MSWKRMVFGKEDPGRTRVVASLLAYVLLAMAIHGWFAPVVPGPWLRGVPGAVLVLAFSLAAGVGFALTVPVRPPRVSTGGFGYPQAEDRGDHGQPLLMAVGVALAMAPLLWLALAKSLPWMLASVGGTAHEQATTLTLEERHSRRGCDFRAYGPALDATFPNYLCVPAQFHAAHAGRTLPVRLVGRETVFGWRIDDIVVEAAPPRDDRP